MVVINTDDIAGQAIDEEHVCLKCLTPNEKKNVSVLLLWSEIEHSNDAIFCDRCGKESIHWR